VIRRTVYALVALLLTCGSVGQAFAAAPPDPTADTTRRMILVTFSNEPSQVAGRAGSTGRRYTGNGYTVAQIAHKQAQRVAQAYSLHEVASWPIRALSVHCVVYEVTDNRSLAMLLATLAKDPEVKLAQPLQQFHTLTQADTAAPTAPTAAGAAPTSAPAASATAPTALTAAPPAADPTAPGPSQYNDPLYDLQTNLAALEIPRAHLRSEGAGVRVGLIDTGVDTSHPDLHNRISGTHSYISNSGGAGSYRHGTAMAGVIAAAANNRVGIVGIAPLAKVEVFEACWQLEPNADAAACNTFTLAQAISAALDAHLPLINLSIAGPADPLLSALVETGLRRGVVFVGAASESADSFPTGIPGVISVGASERNAGTSEVTAPGNHVMTLRPKAQYDFDSGTSIATAEISGVVALLLANSPHLSAASIESLLTQTSTHDGLVKTSDALGKAGVVDANAALVKLRELRGQRVATRSAVD
jgi:subtilisin family serine protease